MAATSGVWARTGPQQFCVGPDICPDKYGLVAEVGGGGEGALWRAEVTLGGVPEPVAVKVLRAELAENFARLSVRWAEQAELLRFVSHPGVVGVREDFQGPPLHREGEAGQVSGRSLYLVMNWVEGRSLRDWVVLNGGREGTLRGLGHLEQVADALELLHAGRATQSGRPVVHGDLSPGNVMISERGQAVLVDFGLVRLTGHRSEFAAGTPGYAAPEVWAQGEYTAAADRYSFGALTYFALTGAPPPLDPVERRAGLLAHPFLANTPAPAADRVMAMFSDDPAQRPPELVAARGPRCGVDVGAQHGGLAGPGAGADRHRALRGCGVVGGVWGAGVAARALVARTLAAGVLGGQCPCSRPGVAAARGDRQPRQSLRVRARPGVADGGWRGSAHRHRGWGPGLGGTVGADGAAGQRWVAAGVEFVLRGGPGHPDPELGGADRCGGGLRRGRALLHEWSARAGRAVGGGSGPGDRGGQLRDLRRRDGVCEVGHRDGGGDVLRADQRAAVRLDPGALGEHGGLLRRDRLGPTAAAQLGPPGGREPDTLSTTGARGLLTCRPVTAGAGPAPASAVHGAHGAPCVGVDGSCPGGRTWGCGRYSPAVPFPGVGWVGGSSPPSAVARAVRTRRA